ncbi:MAG: hypothetical protein SNJ78_06820 [Spirochaetales bacterium]
MELNRVADVDDRVPLRRAIFSTSDKRGVNELAKNLLEICPELVIYSTGGTFTSLENYLGAKLSLKHLRKVTEYTGQPEMQGGLVKTLDYRIYLGLLSETYNDAHRSDLKRMQVEPFDLVVVNLYPFEQAVARSSCTVEEGRTHIDIGGPCLLRAGAKNFLRVAVLSDPADYPDFVQQVKANEGCTTLKQRFLLARKVFSLTSAFDQTISSFFSSLDPETLKEVYTLH